MPRLAPASAALVVLALAAPGVAHAATLVGTDSMAPDGTPTSTIVYTAEPGEVNAVSIDYASNTWTVTDEGQAVHIDSSGTCSTQGKTATCTTPAGAQRTVKVYLGDEDDVLTLTGGVYVDSELMGQDGHDTVTGGAGPDRIYGGLGSDSLSGRVGNDRLAGAESLPGDAQGTDVDDDALDGGDGNDTLFGGVGDNPKLNGGPGNDLIAAGLGDDVANGGPGDDQVAGEGEDDDLSGGDGDDQLDGGADDDVVKGGNGADNVLGSDGRDTLYADADDAPGAEGPNTLHGGSGGDTIFGSDGVDIISGDLDADKIAAGAGNDVVDGCDPTAAGCGADGSDIISAGPGDDRVSGNAGPDLIGGDDGNDTIAGGAAGDELHGGTGNDLITDGAGADVIDGEDGDDYLVAGSRSEREADVFACGDGADRALPASRDVLRIDCERAVAQAKCPKAARRGCKATLVLVGKRRTVGRGSARLKRHASKPVAARVNRRGRRLVASIHRLKVTGRLKVTDRRTGKTLSKTKTRFAISERPKASRNA